MAAIAVRDWIGRFTWLKAHKRIGQRLVDEAARTGPAGTCPRVETCASQLQGAQPDPQVAALVLLGRIGAEEDARAQEVLLVEGGLGDSQALVVLPSHIQLERPPIAGLRNQVHLPLAHMHGVDVRVRHDGKLSEEALRLRREERNEAVALVQQQLATDEALARAVMQ